MRFFHSKGLWARIYKVPIGTAVLISSPILLLASWLTLNAYLDYYRFIGHTSGGKFSPKFTTEMLHWFARDNLRRSYLRLTAPEMPENDELETIQLSIDPEYLVELNRDLPRSGKANDFRAYLKYDGRNYTVKARYTGDNYWHWLFTQKSWRIKTKRTELANGSRKINIKKTRTKETFNEVIAMDLARELGLLAPRMRPVKFIQNNVYMGVYLLGDKIDESVLRRNGRMPGSIYVGDYGPPNPVTGVSQLWEHDRFWVKDASRNAQEENFRGDMQLLIEGVSAPTPLEFYHFAETYLDKGRYAKYVSLDNALASGHHDFHHNHMYYFDPFLGKYEPISWDLDTWHTNTNRFDFTGNPLLNAWKMIPAYELLRQKQLYSLIQPGELLSLGQISGRIDEYHKAIRPALAADVYRDTKSHNGIVMLKMPQIPFTTFSDEEFDNSVERLKSGLASRMAFIRDHLNRSELGYRLTIEQGRTRLDLFVAGNVGRVVTEIVIAGSADGAELWRDQNRNGIPDSEDVNVSTAKGGKFVLNETVLPGFKKVKSDRPPRMFGTEELVASPLQYTYFIVGGGVAGETAEIASRNVVTNEVLPAIHLAASEIGDAEGTASLHPWELPRPLEARQIRLGPGVVEMRESLYVRAEESLDVVSGTTLRLGPGVSIVSHGSVRFAGAPSSPVVVEQLEAGRPWGVIAVQGDKADGSVMRHCSISGGSVDTHNLVYYSGAVSFHGVSDLTIQDCRFGENEIGDDTVHIGYAKSFLIERSGFFNGNSDALDVDISTGRIADSWFRGNGNDAVDLMTSNVEIFGSVMSDNGDKGVSVGENSTLTLSNTLLQRNAIGIEVKDQSIVNFGDNVIAESPLGVNLYNKNWRYGGGGNLNADRLRVFEVETPIVKDKSSHYHIEGIDYLAERDVREVHSAYEFGSIPDVTY